MPEENIVVAISNSLGGDVDHWLRVGNLGGACDWLASVCPPRWPWVLVLRSSVGLPLWGAIVLALVGAMLWWWTLMIPPISALIVRWFGVVKGAWCES